MMEVLSVVYLPVGDVRHPVLTQGQKDLFLSAAIKDVVLSLVVAGFHVAVFVTDAMNSSICFRCCSSKDLITVGVI